MHFIILVKITGYLSMKVSDFQVRGIKLSVVVEVKVYQVLLPNLKNIAVRLMLDFTIPLQHVSDFIDLILPSNCNCVDNGCINAPIFLHVKDFN